MTETADFRRAWLRRQARNGQLVWPLMTDEEREQAILDMTTKEQDR